MKRLKIAQFIALGATMLSALGFYLTYYGGDHLLGSDLMALGFLVGIVSYFFGGFGAALRMAWKIACFGWIIVPMPYNLGAGVMTFGFAILVFLFLPIIPVRAAYKESL